MLVTPASISPTVLTDSDDDVVVACALPAGSDFIVSGDADLLNLKQFQSIPIITVAAVLNKIASAS
jgi:uncharacterized protein